MPDPTTVLPKTPKCIGIAADHGGYELVEKFNQPFDKLMETLAKR